MTVGYNPLEVFLWRGNASAENRMCLDRTPLNNLNVGSVPGPPGQKGRIGGGCPPQCLETIPGGERGQLIILLQVNPWTREGDAWLVRSTPGNKGVTPPSAL